MQIVKICQLKVKNKQDQLMTRSHQQLWLSFFETSWQCYSNKFLKVKLPKQSAKLKCRHLQTR